MSFIMGVMSRDSGGSMGKAEATDRTTEQLLAGGFIRAGAWHRHATSGSIEFRGDDLLPPSPGVYAYAIKGVVHYVGSAQRGLRGRLRRYEITKTMRTSVRVRKEILKFLIKGGEVEVFTIVPPSETIRGLPVDMVAGLEEGLIKAWRPEWNRRGKGKSKKKSS